jgi:hypothetical protein
MIELIKDIAFTEQEIKVIENLFFEGTNVFNDEQVSVINCFSSQNIQACPGSGKTTTLAAKLLLLKKNLSSKQMLEEGFMKFDEAYSLAYRYLREHDSLLTLFSKRFPLVFLDEMQDTEEHQFELIKNIFATSVLQTIGDGNQDIFGHYESISANWPVSESFSIATSSRFPNHIAMILQKIAVEPQSVRGRNEGAFIKPCIFIFDDNSVGRVKYEFVERIVENGLHQKKNAVLKLLGQEKITMGCQSPAI